MKIKLLLAFSLITSSLFSQNLYDINTITQLELSFFDANWDDSLTYYKLNDLDNRMFANCVINGIAFDSVGVKYKGNSTFDPNWVKKPLNISDLTNGMYVVEVGQNDFKKFVINR